MRILKATAQFAGGLTTVEDKEPGTEVGTIGLAHDTDWVGTRTDVGLTTFAMEWAEARLAGTDGASWLLTVRLPAAIPGAGWVPYGLQQVLAETVAKMMAEAGVSTEQVLGAGMLEDRMIAAAARMY